MKRLLAGLVVLVLILAGGGWYYREPLTLFVVGNMGKRAVAAERDITWDSAPATSTPRDAERPNIILILADDLGINDISTFGGGIIETPNIDRLAREGATFRQAYSGTATCAPSRAMIMTGRYPTRTGFEFTPTLDGMARMVAMMSDPDASGLPPVEHNEENARLAPPFADQGLPGSEITIAETLKSAGYHTVHIGKWHTGLGPEFGPNAQGFDEALIMASGLHIAENDPSAVNAKLPFDPIDKFLWSRMQHAASFNEGDWFKPGGYLADYWTDESLKVIEANRERPFFLKLAHWGVHTPLQALREDYEAVGPMSPDRKRVYAAMVRAIDRSVGRILDKLEEEGLSDNTLVVFSSDNGGAGYIGIPGVNAPYRGWKLTLFEGGIRVPLLMRWPGQIPAGLVVEPPVAHIDLMPTLTRAGGAVLPETLEIDGVDLNPWARGLAAADQRPHEEIFWQSAYYRVIRRGDWKLQVTERPKRQWLFDLKNDPTEKTNLADTHPEIVAELRARLDAHQATARPPLYPYKNEGPTAIDKTLAEKAGPTDEFIYWPN